MAGPRICADGADNISHRFTLIETDGDLLDGYLARHPPIIVILSVSLPYPTGLWRSVTKTAPTCSKGHFQHHKNDAHLSPKR